MSNWSYQNSDKEPEIGDIVQDKTNFRFVVMEIDKEYTGKKHNPLLEPDDPESEEITLTRPSELRLI